ncbi:hypothetical protein TRIATDRAFT_317097 [Trichoderma atroviride IMI 206040]|uniref:Uncharacterized protein n=1 Tax=Hypocrea atroviridis (strain ATCC 20476 / IMI 206040) TaxID=452589 RepID=G9NQ05_HYPAI|nr:uncharacterized protein TRIATDRAFT_317097 [Trichoderma atroviride IMI 206040]EHK47157.1 hypothetical protein TRIATDRAFT_317097 [Trichoderma atroviride IMI 206040]
MSPHSPPLKSSPPKQSGYRGFSKRIDPSILPFPLVFPYPCSHIGHLIGHKRCLDK